jgi:hypothetical protein
MGLNDEGKLQNYPSCCSSVLLKLLVKKILCVTTPLIRRRSPTQAHSAYVPLDSDSISCELVLRDACSIERID